MGLVSLFNGVREIKTLNVLYAEDHVVGHRLEQVRLVFQSQVLYCVAAKDGQRVQGPGDLFDNSRFKCKNESL